MMWPKSQLLAIAGDLKRGKDNLFTVEAVFKCKSFVKGPSAHTQSP